MLKNIGLIILGMLLLFLDFISKAYIYYLLPRSLCPEGICHSIPVFDFGGISFAITFAMNQGIAWGLLANFQIALLMLRIAIVLGLVVYLFFFNQRKIAELPLLLVIAGAVGNIADFFLYGFVVDFFEFHFWGYPFPIFNVADMWITVGVVWLLVLSCMKQSQVKK